MESSHIEGSGQRDISLKKKQSIIIIIIIIMAAEPFVMYKAQMSSLSIGVDILKAHVSKTQTAEIFREMVTDRKALSRTAADPSVDLVAAFKTDERLLRGFLRPSRWEDKGCPLSEDLSVYTGLL